MTPFNPQALILTETRGAARPERRTLSLLKSEPDRDHFPGRPDRGRRILAGRPQPKRRSVGAAFPGSAGATDPRTQPGTERRNRTARLPSHQPRSLSRPVPDGARATAADPRSHAGPSRRQPATIGEPQPAAPAHGRKVRRTAQHRRGIQGRPQRRGAEHRRQRPRIPADAGDPRHRSAKCNPSKTTFTYSGNRRPSNPACCSKLGLPRRSS